MEVRSAFNSVAPCLNWLKSRDVFRFMDNHSLIPSIELACKQNGQILKTVKLEGQPFYIIGSNPDQASVTLHDETVSGMHAAIVIDKDDGPLIVDLNSAFKTFGGIDSTKELTPFVPTCLEKDHCLTFGECNYSYTITNIDFSKIEKFYRDQESQLQKELNSMSNLDRIANLDK